MCRSREECCFCSATALPSTNVRNLISLRSPSISVALLLLTLIWCLHTVQCWGDTVVDAEAGTVGGRGGTFLLAAIDELFPRERRARRFPEAASRELGWRKRRYYVGRWGSGGGGGRRAGRRFVPVQQSEESAGSSEPDEVAKRLCGLKLTNRTKQLCGDCVPANMRQVILLDKKRGGSSSSSSSNTHAFSKERLTEMCCVQRCTDEQIRSFCCRGRT
uniref:IlGF domain-containing protein n=1 Tax=Globodera pallida TaxID=36090 RepID=A0A183CE98_GLOPA